MLNDDLTGTLGTALRATGAVIKGALKGILIGGAIALAVVTLGPVVGAIGSAIAGTAAWGGVATAAGAMGTHLMAGLATVGLGAKIGAAVLGVASVIPGLKEWPELFKKGVAVPHKVSEYSSEVVQAAAPNLNKEQENIYADPQKTAWAERMKQQRIDEAAQSQAACR